MSPAASRSPHLQESPCTVKENTLGETPTHLPPLPEGWLLVFPRYSATQGEKSRRGRKALKRMRRLKLGKGFRKTVGAHALSLRQKDCSLQCGMWGTRFFCQPSASSRAPMTPTDAHEESDPLCIQTSGLSVAVPYCAYIVAISSRSLNSAILSFPNRNIHPLSWGGFYWLSADSLLLSSVSPQPRRVTQAWKAMETHSNAHTSWIIDNTEHGVDSSIQTYDRKVNLGFKMWKEECIAAKEWDLSLYAACHLKSPCVCSKCPEFSCHICAPSCNHQQPHMEHTIHLLSGAPRKYGSQMVLLQSAFLSRVQAAELPPGRTEQNYLGQRKNQSKLPLGIKQHSRPI